jgi:hypothetical protein
LRIDKGRDFYKFKKPGRSAQAFILASGLELAGIPQLAEVERRVSSIANLVGMWLEKGTLAVLAHKSLAYVRNYVDKT